MMTLADAARRLQSFEGDSQGDRLYVLGLEHPLRFLEGKRALTSVLSRNARLAGEFSRRYGDRFSVVGEYFRYRRERVNLVDLTQVVPLLRGVDLSTEPVDEDI